MRCGVSLCLLILVQKCHASVIVLQHSISTSCFTLCIIVHHSNIRVILGLHGDNGKRK